MSFTDFTVLELKSVAKKTGVDLGDAKKKTEIISTLEGEGVTFEYYQEKFVDVEKADDLPAEKKEERPTPKADSVILRLVTGWSLLETQWGIASQNSPFILVNKEDVAEATKSGDFRVATEEEVLKAYGLGK